MDENLQEDVEENKQEKDQQRQNNPNRKKSLRKGIGTLKDNIVGAFRGSAKDIFILKAKLVIYGALAVLILITLFIEGVLEDTSSKASSSVETVLLKSTTKGAETFNKTGSLILADDEELDKVAQEFLDSLGTSDEAYTDALSVVYSGRTDTPIAENIKHITTNKSSEETTELTPVTTTTSKLSGATSLAESRTLIEHIFRAEKYNFNNIKWRSFEKSGNSIVQKSVPMQLDSESKLQYPATDANETDNATHTLDFFISKTRSYLQSWYIPFDMMLGTIDGQSDANYNGKFAYEILAKGYHEIVLDRYKVETLERTNEYLVYDKTTQVEEWTRTCADYERTTTSTQTVTVRKARISMYSFGQSC